MKAFFRFVSFFCFVVLSMVPVSAQQVKTTGTEQEIPNKTVILRDPGVEQPADFLSGAQMLSFWIYKAGSTNDVSRIIRSFKSAEGVKKVTEGPVSGDLKEIIIELNSPRDLGWYKTLFSNAGLKYIKLNTAEPKPISEL